MSIHLDSKSPEPASNPMSNTEDWISTLRCVTCGIHSNGKEPSTENSVFRSVKYLLLDQPSHKEQPLTPDKNVRCQKTIKADRYQRGWPLVRGERPGRDFHIL